MDDQVEARGYWPPPRQAKRLQGKQGLINRYLSAARREDWTACREAAERLIASRLTETECGEATYALGYAAEMLGEVGSARKHYEAAIGMSGGHARAQRRLAALNGHSAT